MERDDIDEKIEFLLQDMNRKVDLIIESTELLRGDIRELDRKAAERFDAIYIKLDAMINKFDNVSAGLSVHRADT